MLTILLCNFIYSYNFVLGNILLSSWLVPADNRCGVTVPDTPNILYRIYCAN